VTADLDQADRTLQHLTGVPPVGFAYPFGALRRRPNQGPTNTRRPAKNHFSALRTRIPARRPNFTPTRHLRRPADHATRADILPWTGVELLAYNKWSATPVPTARPVMAAAALCQSRRRQEVAHRARRPSFPIRVSQRLKNEDSLARINSLKLAGYSGAPTTRHVVSRARVMPEDRSAIRPD
jgi:hypothetical protein